jgi:hypothetical protein
MAVSQSASQKLGLFKRKCFLTQLLEICILRRFEICRLTWKGRNVV